MNHSAYCMMIRSLYDLYPSKRNSGNGKSSVVRSATVRTEVDPTLKKLRATERACEKRYNEGKFRSDAEAIEWCVKSISRKKLGNVSWYSSKLGDIMRTAISRVNMPNVTYAADDTEYEDFYDGEHESGDDIPQAVFDAIFARK